MSNETFAMGWRRDYPDFRDYDVNHDAAEGRVKMYAQRTVKDNLKKLGFFKEKMPALAPKVDLHAFCSPIEDQMSLGSCTANAGVGMVEYFERRAFGAHVDASRLFLYKVTRNLMGETGDTGAYLRNTMGALTLFGTPPERYWPYTDAHPDFDVEPSAFCYAYAQNYQALQYYRLDPFGTAPNNVLQKIKTNLAAGLPSMFGFSVFSSYDQSVSEGAFPFPLDGEKIVGGHALVAIGYDDAKQITNTNPGGPQTVGALMIRNSWGVGWAASSSIAPGYGWLPYDYVLKGLAVDWWSLIKNEWVDTKNFGF
jgi:C1A family cysteine protease